jgi:hypothetical protein
VLEIEDQLRRYGDAFERHLLDETIAEVGPERRWRPGRRRLVWASVAVVVVAIAVIISTLLGDDSSVVSTPPPTTTGAGGPGVFSTATNVVLLFSDGIDGVTAIDLDNRLAGRRVVEGERAGDQPFRLTLTGDDLVVGWENIYAAPLSGAPSMRIAEATIYIPASEPGEVWTVTWEGGRTGQGSSSLQRVRTDGTVTFTADEFDATLLEPLLGVPGGLAVATPEGIAVWDASTESIGPVLGPGGPASAVASNGRDLVWCDSTCASTHIVPLDRGGPPTARHVSPGRQQIALAPDGQLAVLRPVGDQAQLVILDRSTGGESAVASQLDPLGVLQWDSDGRQLFYTENSYQGPTTRIGRYITTDGTWEVTNIPVESGLGAIAIDQAEASSFFTDDHVAAYECPGAGNVYPSGHVGVCTFAFSNPARSADQCVASGEGVITVPDARGERLDNAIVLMQQAGLSVIGQGVPDGDPAGDDAAVLAQEPPAGSLVPVGACIGFRTDDVARSSSSSDAPGVPCPDSVLRRADGGDPGADGLPNVDDAVVDRADAVEIFEANRDVLLDRYDATAIELGRGFGRAWQGENGGDYMVVNVDDFGILVTLRSIDECPAGADLYRRAGGIPLFFFVPS